MTAPEARRITAIRDALPETLRCPKCHGELEAFYQRQQKLFCVMHRRRTDCKIEEFGRSEKGGTPQQAMERAKANLAALTNK